MTSSFFVAEKIIVGIERIGNAPKNQVSWEVCIFLYNYTFPGFNIRNLDIPIQKLISGGTKLIRITDSPG